MSAHTTTVRSDPDSIAFDIDYQRVLNAVTHLNWDPNGTKLCKLTDDAVANNTLIYVPPGRYKIAPESAITKDELRNFGLVGAGSDKVTFVSSDRTPGFWLVSTVKGNGNEFGGVTFDWGPRKDTAGGAVRMKPYDRLYTHDIEWTGIYATRKPRRFHSWRHADPRRRGPRRHIQMQRIGVGGWRASRL